MENITQKINNQIVSVMALLEKIAQANGTAGSRWSFAGHELNVAGEDLQAIEAIINELFSLTATHSVYA